MATIGTVAGNAIGIYKGSVLIGCATSASMDLSTTMTDSTCKDNDGAEQVTAGQKSWSMALDGMLAFDTTPEEGWMELFDAWDTKELLTIKWGTGVTGDPAYTGTAYIDSLSASAPLNEASTYNVNFRGTGVLVASTEP